MDAGPLGAGRSRTGWIAFAGAYLLVAGAMADRLPKRVTVVVVFMIGVSPLWGYYSWVMVRPVYEVLAGGL